MALTTIREIVVRSGNLGAERADLLVVPLAKGERSLPDEVAKALGGPGAVTALLQSGDFTGELNKTALAYGASPSFSRVLLVGTGEAAKLDAEKFRQVVATSARVGRDLSCGSALLMLPLAGLSLSLEDQLEFAAEAALLGAYEYDAPKIRTEEEKKELGTLAFLVPANQSGAAAAALRRGLARAAGTNFARDLANTPANLLNPTHLAAAAAKKAAESGLSCRIIERDEAAELGMGAFLGVAEGSAQPPKFILLEYAGTDPAAPTIGLIGKGLTFDAGGISLKPAAKMDEMKYDMCGAAAVIGAMSTLQALGVRARVIGAVPATENMPGGRATKPGDVHRSYSGKTIEILNTDAEGRLVLADALTYVARQYQPAVMIDLATLTGAVVIALGHYGAAVLSNDDALCERIQAAAARSGDRTWRLPIWEEYAEHLKTPFADVKNIADGNAGAGTIAGAAFLAEFVEGLPWAHIDIAGTAWWDKDRPHLPKGASGYGVRLLIDLIESYGR